MANCIQTAGARPKSSTNSFAQYLLIRTPLNMPKLEGPPTTPMNNIEITQSGITKLLSELNVDKAPGPDELPNLLLKSAAKEISPFLTDIFEHSIRTGKLPDEWVEANVAPVFKKRDRHTASNYRPISLTCVCAKLLNTLFARTSWPSLPKTKF